MKIYITGSPGSGKTTSAWELSRRYSIPAYELDEIVWDNSEGFTGAKHPVDARDGKIAEMLGMRSWVAEGFYFDEARGTMKFENGTSYTDDLLLSSTAADITITSSTDLVAQTFDYEFAVRPGVSKTLPVIGAIAGGPVGAAAGLALQALLRDALGEATEARYTIRGPWTDPKVEPIGKLPTPSGGDTNLDPDVAPEEQTEEQTDKETGPAGQQSTDENIND